MRHGITWYMGWLPLVGSLKLQVSFAKKPYKRAYNSAKETYNFKEPTNRSHPTAALRAVALRCTRVGADETYLYVCCYVFICVMWCVHMCGVMYSYVWCDVFVRSLWVHHITHMNTSHYTYEYIALHIWIHHITHMNTSHHTYEYITLHIWIHHITHMNTSHHTYEYITLHIWIHRITHMNTSHYTYEYIALHIWIHHITHMNTSHHTHAICDEIAPPPLNIQVAPLRMCKCNMTAVTGARDSRWGREWASERARENERERVWGRVRESEGKRMR